jgi:hypothetical protein
MNRDNITNNMKKFKEGEIRYNVIKTHPKFEMYSNGGIVRFNRQNYPSVESDVPIESISISELIHKIPVAVAASALDNAILAENSDPITAESGDNLIVES